MLWLQLLSYSIGWWMAFLAIIVITASFGRWRGVVFGPCLVALLVFVLDLHWMESQLSDPDWDGIPDYDLVFAIGVGVRVVLVNTVLLPVRIVCKLRASRRRLENTERHRNISTISQNSPQ